jgi:hypothetical protein
MSAVGDLAERSDGYHRVPLTDTLIAAAAAEHDSIALLHRFAGAQWQRRAAPRDRDGHLGLGATSAPAHGARLIAGRANVLRDRRADARQAVVECRGTPVLKTQSAKAGAAVRSRFALPRQQRIEPTPPRRVQSRSVTGARWGASFRVKHKRVRHSQCYTRWRRLPGQECHGLEWPVRHPRYTRRPPNRKPRGWFDAECEAIPNSSTQPCKAVAAGAWRRARSSR